MNKVKKEHNTIQFEQPIKREGEEITSVQVRTPASGELRGLSLFDLMNLQVNSLNTLLPRITIPSITEPECKALHPADLVKLGTAVANFLAPSSQTAEQ